ncbi:hypothetical protein IAT38_005700 [Cryptococcus sp. DSM 104549]
MDLFSAFCQLDDAVQAHKTAPRITIAIEIWGPTPDPQPIPPPREEFSPPRIIRLSGNQPPASAVADDYLRLFHKVRPPSDMRVPYFRS